MVEKFKKAKYDDLKEGSTVEPNTWYVISPDSTLDAVHDLLDQGATVFFKVGKKQVKLVKSVVDP